MPVVDDVSALAVREGTTPSERGDGRDAEEAFEPIVEDADAQAMPDQSRGHGVEHAPQDEATRRRHWDHLLLEVGCTALRQGTQRRPFQCDGLGEIGVAAADDRVDEGAIGVEIGEVARAAQQQGVRERLLEMAVRAFDRAVLVGDADVVARRGHAVVAHQRRIALRDVFPRIGGQVAERCRQAIAAVLLWRAAERPQRVLQALSQEPRHASSHYRRSLCPERFLLFQP